MTGRVGSCPACGAELEFRNAGTLWVACPYCGGASTRTDIDLEFHGKVAQVSPIASPFALGQRRRMDERWFTILGQRQLDHGSGPWNEWYIAFDDGKDGWLAEAQGRLLLLRKVPLPEGLPKKRNLTLGMSVDLGGGEYTVAERGEGTVVAAAGEFPGPEVVGWPFQYADLSGPGRAVATLDYGKGDDVVAVYQGRTCEPADFGLGPEEFVGGAPRRTGAERLACPKCAGQLDLRDPSSVRVGCASCGSLLDTTTGTLRVISVAASARQPFLPLGSRGVLRGTRYEVRAMMERFVMSGGMRYAWEEFLLADETAGYRWLTRNDHHWSFVEPVALGDVKVFAKTATRLGRTYRHFQGGRAEVAFVVGELYWEASLGESASTADYVAPPETLSVEDSKTERIVTLCTWIPPAEVGAAFLPGKAMPRPRGVAPNQPNPHVEGRRAFGLLFGVLALLLCAMTLYSCATARKRIVFNRALVADRALTGKDTPPTATEEEEAGGRVIVSDPFRLEESTNLEIALDTGLANEWLGIDGALVDLGTGDVRAFSLLVEYYEGVEGGERWSEGSRSAKTWLGSLPPGEYALRLEPATAAGAGLLPYTVTAREDVPSVGRFFLLMGLLLLFPACVAVAHQAFESKRWANSDHAA